MRNALPALLLLGLLAAPARAAWTDPTLTAGTTPIRKVHIDELRTTINGQRSNFGMTTTSWTDPTITAGTTEIRKVHIDELRTTISGLRSTYNPICPSVVPAAPSFTDPTITAGATNIRAVHITELRAASDAVGTCGACCAQTCKGTPCTGTGCSNLGATSEGNEGGGAACAVCYDCNGSGSCAVVGNGTPDVGCDTGATACSAADICNGAGACAPGHYGAGTDCGICYQCDGSGSCVGTVSGDDPQGGCGYHSIFGWTAGYCYCNGAGSCINGTTTGSCS